jgi:hypothetical protein
VIALVMVVLSPIFAAWTATNTSRLHAAGFTTVSPRFHWLARARGDPYRTNKPFENIATASFAFARTMTVDDAVDWLATYSGLITAPAGERAAALARSREALLRRADTDGKIEMPLRSASWRADRVRRRL